MKHHTPATHALQRQRRTPYRPESVPIVDIDADFDPPFATGVHDVLDADLRHRIVSEAAFHRLADRGYDEAGEIDDWLEAEAEVEHSLASRPSEAAEER